MQNNECKRIDKKTENIVSLGIDLLRSTGDVEHAAKYMAVMGVPESVALRVLLNREQRRLIDKN